MNRIHTISVPYSVMKACPLSWVQRVHVHKGKGILSICACSYVIVIWIMAIMLNQQFCCTVSKVLSCLCLHTARMALVKCRDLHWAMMAHRDQKDTTLSSLRMLIVADGANPCKETR